MATSGTFAYAPIADDLITEAFERCGLSPAVIQGPMARSARMSLQLMLIDWTNDQVPLWQVETVTTTLMPGQVTFTLPAEVADILDAYVTDASGVDRYLGRIGRSDYAGYSNKLISDRPSQILTTRSLPSPVVTFYPVPDQIYTFTAYCLRQPQDIGALYQTPEAPVLWSEAMAAGLAERIAIKYAPERVSLLQPLASATYARARGESRERVPFTLLPDMRDC